MTFDEKVFIGLALAGITAVVLFRKKDIAAIIAPSDDVPLPATAYVGMSQTPQNSSFTQGPMYGNYNQRYAFWPPLNNFLPTISAGQGAQTVENPHQFVRRWFGTLANRQETLQ